MSKPQSELEKEFQEYGWDGDAEWQRSVNNIDFPPSWDEKKKQDHLLKRKRKYYQQKVNPAYIPPESDLNSTTSPRKQGPSDTKGTDNSNSSNREEPSKTFDEKDSGNTQQKTTPKTQKPTPQKPASQNRQAQ